MTGGTSVLHGPDDAGPGDPGASLIEARGLSVAFSRGRQTARAVEGVDLTIRRGEVLCVVGESGCGKSTLGRALLQLVKPTSGRVVFDGVELTALNRHRMRAVRPRMQMIFQDPYASLNPKMTVGAILAEPLTIHRAVAARERPARVAAALRDVGLGERAAARYPHQLSGGQRQRVGIARALMLDPPFVVADEPVAALDVSIQAQVVNLLQDLQESRHLTLLVISHDLAVVRQLADRIAVMYLGKIVELGERDQIYSAPLHPYTQALLSAAPTPDPDVESTRERIVLEGELPSVYNRPSGCAFHTRCPLRRQLGDPAACVDMEPPLSQHTGGHAAACHFTEEVRDHD